ncbi:MAG: isoprenyl transferase [Lachnospiraceae bacterium]|nr:isoprenyl transferase [Lachnospiraceae bacterium]
MDQFNEDLGLRVPNHVAIILDGNGRWAKAHHVPRNIGHSAGSKAVEQICEDAYHLGIKYLTVYAFSTENWKRSSEEVSALMLLLRNYLKDCIKRATSNNMRVLVIGDKSGLAADIVATIEQLEEMTAKNTGLTFTIALNYGGRDELRRAMVDMAKQVQEGKLKPEEITEEMISNHLDTKLLPDPDLLIRTSGEERLSNFLPWQLCYTEFYFPTVLWPDFDKNELIKAIEKYNARERRFGGRKEE